MPACSLILFHSPAHAIRSEKVLQQAGVATKLIPTPRALSSDCGMALRFSRVDQERVARALAETDVPIREIKEMG